MTIRTVKRLLCCPEGAALRERPRAVAAAAAAAAGRCRWKAARHSANASRCSARAASHSLARRTIRIARSMLHYIVTASVTRKLCFYFALVSFSVFIFQIMLVITKYLLLRDGTFKMRTYSIYLYRSSF